MEKSSVNRLGRVITLATASALLLVGLLLGFLPVQFDGAWCGSAFVAGDYYTTPLSCSQVRSTMLAFAIAAIAASVVFALATVAFVEVEAPGVIPRDGEQVDPAP